MEIPFLTGFYDQVLDDKSRLLIPAPLRKRVNAAIHGESFYLVISPERRIWMYPGRYFEWLFTRGTEADAIPQRDLLAFDRLTLGLALEVEPDKAGRVVIPESHRKRVGLAGGGAVTVVGNRDHLEVWDTAAWNASSDQLLDRGEDLIERARAARRGEPFTLKTMNVTGMEGTL